MNYRDKTKDELIKELQKLQQDYDSLKISYRKDISECRLIETELHLQSEIMKNITEGVLLIRQDNEVIVFTNQKFDEMFGYGHGELIGRHVSILNAPAGKSPEEIKQDIVDTISIMREWHGEILNIKKNGETFWCNANVSVFDHPDYGKVFLSVHTDITERKGAEARLKLALEWQEAIFEGSRDSIFISDQDSRFVAVNNSACDLTGYSREKLLKMGIPDIHDVSDLDAYRTYHQRIMSGEEILSEAKIMRSDGIKVDTEFSNRCVSISGRQYMHTTARNITERKQSEEKLRDNESRFRIFVEQAPVSIGVFSLDGIGLYANQKFLDSLGLKSVDEMSGRPATEYFAPQFREERKERTQRRLLGLPVPLEYESVAMRSDGSQFPVTLAVAPIQLSDGIASIAFLFDTSRHKQAEATLKESEARYRSLFENSLMGISVADTDGHLVQANLAYAQMYGYKNLEEMLSEITNVGMLYANPVERKEVIRILRSKGFMEAREVEVVRRDGSRFFVLVSASEIRDSEGKLLYNQAIHIDVSDRRRNEGEIKKSKELLEKLNQHLNEIREEERALISRKIHDELGQSMTALKLDLNRMHKYLNTNPEAVAKLKSMIELVSDTIKDVQRISSDLRPGILDELGLVSAIEWYCDEFEERTGIKCNLKLDDSDYIDSQISLTFFRVLQETLTNVIRHANASSVNIKLQKQNKGMTMTIKDDGIGIPEEKLRSIKSLGLISMRERIKQNNGTIDISSKKDNGTKLVIFIPS